MEYKLLPEVCHIQYGYPFDSEKFSKSEGIPLIRIRDVVRGFTETFTKELCSKEYVVKKGDILVGMDGMFNIAKWEGQTGYLNQRVCKLVPNNLIFGDYLFYYMPCALKKIEDKTAFVTVKHLKAKQLNSILVPCPPIEEQKKISKVLSVIFQLIKQKEAQLEYLDELIKSRFVEMFSNERQHYRLNEVCKIITDGTHQPPEFVSCGIPFIFVSNIVNNEISYNTEKYITQETYNSLIVRTPIEMGDIILSTVGSYGHPAIVKNNKKFLFQRHIAYLKPKHEIVDSDFLHSALLSSNVQQQIDRQVKGIAQKTLNLSAIKQLVVPIPKILEQRKFARLKNHIDKSKLAVKKSLEELETLKNSLMQQYFD